MASSIPFVRQVAWLSVVPQLALLGGFILLFDALSLENPALFGALAYLALSFSLRNFLAADHRKGIQLVRQLKFEEAIPLFEKSVAFFSRHDWVDRFRFLTLLSSSKISYQEMGLCNIAFCYSQTGNGEKAREYYERTLQQFPESGLATAGLNMILAASPRTPEGE